MKLRTLEQERAQFAYQKIKEISEESHDLQKKYLSYIKSSATLILTNGLGNTLAFYLSKAKVPYDDRDFENKLKECKDGEKAYCKLYLHITEWLRKQGYGGITWIISSDSIQVFQATREALCLINWMKKFAEAMLKEE